MVIDWVLAVAWVLFFLATFLFIRVLLQVKLHVIKQELTLQSNYLGIIVLFIMAIAVRLLFER